MLAAIRDIDALTPETAAKCRAFLLAAKAAGLDVFVTETRRSSERQAALWAMGRTRPGRIVTRSKAGTGKHEFGLAFDVAFRGANLYPSDVKTWARLGAIGKACGLTWGGDFKGVDSVHFENDNKKGSIMGDIEMGAAAVPAAVNPAVAVAPVATVPKAAVVDVVAEKTSKLPTLKSATAAAVVTGLLAVLPAVAMVFPPLQPFVGAVNAIAKLFGYGV